MHAWIRTSHGIRGLVALMLFCALLIRALLPAGFMPVRDRLGITVAICSGQGEVTQFVPIERKDGAPDPRRAASDVCAFAAALGGGLVAPPLPALAEPAPAAFAALAPGMLADFTVRRLAAPPPPALGPPAHA